MSKFCSTAIAAAATLALSIVLSGCDAINTKGRQVDSSLTQDTVEQRILGYLTESLGILPPETTLSRSFPGSPNRRLGSGGVIPCDDGNIVKDGPVAFAVSYWVDGVPPGQGQNYFDSLALGWDGKGWSLSGREKSNRKMLNADTSDGFTVTAFLNDGGDLSVAGTSPCFPRENSSGVGRVDTPETIAHP